MIKGISKIRLQIFFLPFVLLIFSCNKIERVESSQDKTSLGTTDSIFLEQIYITQSPDFGLYDSWLNFDEALRLNENED